MRPARSPSGEFCPGRSGAGGSKADRETWGHSRGSLREGWRARPSRSPPAWCVAQSTRHQGGSLCSSDPRPPANDSHVLQAGGRAHGSFPAWPTSCSVLGWSPACKGDPGRGRRRHTEQHPGPRLLGHHTGPLPLAWPGWRQGRVPGSLALCPAGPWKVTCPRLALGRLLEDDPFCSHSGSPGASERGHEWPWARPPKRAVVGRGAGRRERAFEHTEVSRPGPPGPGDQNPPVGSKSSEISYEPPTTWQT